MPGLVIKFPAGDRIIINGAVVENAGRGARLRLLSPDTQLLRLRDALDPEKANTPVGRITHAVQLAVAGEAPVEEVRTKAMPALDALAQAFLDAADRDMIGEIRALLAKGDAYRALRRLQVLRVREAQLLGIEP